MKTTLIIDEKATQEDFPNAIIITKMDAFNIYNLKDGEEIQLTGNYTAKARLLGDNYIFSGKDFENASLSKEAVHNIINKFYYIGQKLKPGNPKK